MLRPYKRLQEPLRCDVCGQPIQDEATGIVLFEERYRRDLAPEKYIVIHKIACDKKKGAPGYVLRSMEISELRRLEYLPPSQH
jgi:hypothetical protein